MDQNIVSMREVQRNYKQIFRRAKEERGPVFLGSHGKIQAVILGIDEFNKMKERSEFTKRKIKWEGLEAALDEISNKGRRDVSLSDFVSRDRHAH